MQDEQERAPRVQQLEKEPLPTFNIDELLEGLPTMDELTKRLPKLLETRRPVELPFCLFPEFISVKQVLRITLN